MMMDPVQTFLQEAEDLLCEIESLVVDLENRPEDRETINGIFRAFHTLKGSGAMFGFKEAADFTHHVESALDQVRSGSLAICPRLLALIMAARDQIRTLLFELPSAAIQAGTRRLLEELAQIELDASTSVGSSQLAMPPVETVWLIRFRPPPGVTAIGLDPVVLLDELRALGPTEINADVTGVPLLDALNAEHCFLQWQVQVTTAAPAQSIRDIFLFVEDESELEIREQVDTGEDIPEIAAAPQVPVGLAKDSHGEDEPRAAASVRPASNATLRVSSEKLDRLVSLVGELVMNQSRLAQVAARLGDNELSLPVEEIDRLVAELRDGVLGIRMMPIGSTFSRFKRLVRDLSQELGKEVELVTDGAETELDKSVLDQIGEPLVHLIRNSLDHGIELPAQRRQKGKPSRGTIRLTAKHEGAEVVITIEDDGRGIDPVAIRDKAIERRLLATDASLSERDLFNLIFLPGFSTAASVTNVSGRGVGLDVVKRQLEGIRGSIGLESRVDRGTTFRLTLPLTLAIIDGLLVELGRDRFILPMAAVTENAELHEIERTRQNGRNLISVRGELISYIRLRELFAVAGESPPIEKVVIVRYQGQRIGLVVDRVIGSHQTVIQALGRFYRHISVCSGTTIMGDGTVALILSVDGIIARASREHGGLDRTLSSRSRADGTSVPFNSTRLYT